MLYAGIGGAVVIVAVLAFFLMGDDDKSGTEGATNVAEANTASEPVVDPVVEEVDQAPVADEAPTEPEAAPEPDPVPAEPEIVEPSSPVISHDPFPNPGMDDAEWDALQDAVRKAFIESVRPKARKEARNKLTDAGEYAVTALMNGLIGLDLSQEKDLVDAGNIVLGIQSISLDIIKIPLRLDILDIEENLDFNMKTEKSLFKYWHKYDGPEGIKKFAEKLAKKAELIAEQPTDW